MTNPKQVIIDRVRVKYRDKLEVAIANLSNTDYPYQQAQEEINQLRVTMELEVAQAFEDAQKIDELKEFQKSIQ